MNVKKYYSVSCKKHHIIIEESPEDYCAAALAAPVRLVSTPMRCEVFVAAADSRAAAEAYFRALGYAWARAYAIDNQDINYARSRGVPFVEI